MIEILFIIEVFCGQPNTSPQDGVSFGSWPHSFPFPHEGNSAASTSQSIQIQPYPFDFGYQPNTLPLDDPSLYFCQLSFARPPEGHSTASSSQPNTLPSNHILSLIKDQIKSNPLVYSYKLYRPLEPFLLGLIHYIDTSSDNNIFKKIKNFENEDIETLIKCIEKFLNSNEPNFHFENLTPEQSELKGFLSPFIIYFELEKKNNASKDENSIFKKFIQPKSAGFFKLVLNSYSPEEFIKEVNDLKFTFTDLRTILIVLRNFLNAPCNLFSYRIDKEAIIEDDYRKLIIPAIFRFSACMELCFGIHNSIFSFLLYSPEIYYYFDILSKLFKDKNFLVHQLHPDRIKYFKYFIKSSLILPIRYNFMSIINKNDRTKFFEEISNYIPEDIAVSLFFEICCEYEWGKPDSNKANFVFEFFKILAKNNKQIFLPLYSPYKNIEAFRTALGLKNTPIQLGKNIILKKKTEKILEHYLAVQKAKTPKEIEAFFLIELYKHKFMLMGKNFVYYFCEKFDSSFEPKNESLRAIEMFLKFYEDSPVFLSKHVVFVLEYLNAAHKLNHTFISNLLSDKNTNDLFCDIISHYLFCAIDTLANQDVVFDNSMILYEYYKIIIENPQIIRVDDSDNSILKLKLFRYYESAFPLFHIWGDSRTSKKESPHLQKIDADILKYRNLQDLTDEIFKNAALKYSVSENDSAVGEKLACKWLWLTIIFKYLPYLNEIHLNDLEFLIDKNNLNGEQLKEYFTKTINSFTEKDISQFYFNPEDGLDRSLKEFAPKKSEIYKNADSALYVRVFSKLFKEFLLFCFNNKVIFGEFHIQIFKNILLKTPNLFHSIVSGIVFFIEQNNQHVLAECLCHYLNNFLSNIKSLKYDDVLINELIDTICQSRSIETLFYPLTCCIFKSSEYKFLIIQRFENMILYFFKLKNQNFIKDLFEYFLVNKKIEFNLQECHRICSIFSKDRLMPKKIQNLLKEYFFSIFKDKSKKFKNLPLELLQTAHLAQNV